ncbi:trace amine-associated receptor 13c-like [Alosa pseudoharengus]|uniref:trace amine-associated receptor 13c-like n=1 Tax=Alosa pseudoharengus TaxID=34774 RepID=UPI003F88CF7F
MNISIVNELKCCFNVTTQHAQVPLTFVILYAPVIILTVCGNLLVVISISHFKQLHTPTNFLIFSLATADMMVGVIVLPLHFISKSICFHVSKILCYVCLLCTTNVTFVSIYNVSLISLDRMYALSNPFQYSNKVTAKRMSTIIYMKWSISFCYNMTFVYFNGPATSDMLCLGECSATAKNLWSVIDLMLVFVLPCSVIMVSCMKMFAIARKHAKNIGCAKGQHISRNSKYGHIVTKASERKAATTLGILVVVFVTCLLPYFIFVAMSSFIPDQIIGDVLDGSLTLLYLNSTVNPIIYALFYPWFRTCVKIILMLRIFNPNSSLINVLEKCS